MWPQIFAGDEDYAASVSSDTSTASEMQIFVASENQIFVDIKDAECIIDDDDEGEIKEYTNMGHKGNFKNNKIRTQIFASWLCDIIQQTSTCNAINTLICTEIEEGMQSWNNPFFINLHKVIWRVSQENRS